MPALLRNIDSYNKAYLLGIGGIGMSALARYFKQKGWEVGGYDKTPSPLTDELIEEGIDIHFEDLGPSIPENFMDHEQTLVVYTPAIPVNLGERLHLVHNGFQMYKRAEVLGLITRHTQALCVAGTHGKTTTSTLLAHILNTSDLKCNAFLGGISSNFNSNFIGDQDSEFTVVEADEFDRSFLQLRPYASIVTTTDADHLDIYGSETDFKEGFLEYVKLIDPTGFLIVRAGENLQHPNVLNYAIDEEADFTGINLRFIGDRFLFDLRFEGQFWSDVELGIPGIHNAENAIACIALCIQLGLSEDTIRKGLKTFKGVKRRFEYQVKRNELIYIDDYAHHPTEIKALLSSIRLLYPDKKVTAVFQPHLYSRTRDFFEGFVTELSRADEVILLPIYPAREEPIEGISSDSLLAAISCSNKKLLSPDEVLAYLGKRKEGALLTIGAGDIDRIVPKLKSSLEKA